MVKKGYYCVSIGEAISVIMAELEELFQKRSVIKGHFTRLLRFIRGFKEEDTSQISVRLQMCGDWWAEFEKIQFKIEKLDTEGIDEDLDAREGFEQTYFYCIGQLKKLGEVSGSSSSSQGAQKKCTSAEIRLPVMEVPTFYGSNTGWCEFYETFDTLIDSNEGITDIQKFYYLKNCLKGSAAEVISNLEVSSENYKEAWVLLKQRFENKKIITLGYIDSLFHYEPMTKESSSLLRKFLNEIRKNLRALKNLKVPVENWDIILLYTLETKLDPYTRREWKKHEAVDKFSTIEQFTNFLEARCQLLETINPLSKRVTGNQDNKKPERVHTTLKSFVASNGWCAVCKDGKHTTSDCKKFLDLSVAKKREEVSASNLCWNCLKGGHHAIKCYNKPCKHCGKKHHVLLHENQEAPSAEFSGRSEGKNFDKNITEQPDTTISASTSASTSFNGYNTDLLKQNVDTEILLCTAKVKIWDHRGNAHECRALLDSGSQSSFMTRALRDKLQLRAKRTQISILGIGSSMTNISCYVNAKIYSINSGYNVDSSFLVVDKISDNIPSTCVSTDTLEIPDNIDLADPSFGKSGNIDLLIGVTMFWDILQDGQIKLGINKPILQNTKLGWIVAGPVAAVKYNKIHKVESCNLVSGLSVQEQLEHFWTIEEYPKERLLSREEEACERNFNSHTRRGKDGRFIVRLPIRSEVLELGNSYDVAFKRFQHLERKFNRNAKFKEDYQAFMSEYITMGHMTRILPETSNDGRSTIEVEGKNICYLPHHGVVKETSTTTKLRVVFDASAVTDNGISLNNRLMVGPKLQEDIFCILIRFREHQVIIAADIEKMYRQVLISEDQRDLQRILWRPSVDEPIGHFRLNTVTYGTASASYLAVKCLQQLGLENAAKFPDASRIIIRDFYMDDLLSGSDSVTGAKQIMDEVNKILRSGGFTLRKWLSNRREVLDDNEVPDIDYYIANDDVSKTLGLFWNSRQDSLHFQISASEVLSSSNEKVTKRSILSAVSQIFDPLGLVGPVVIRIKVLLQDLWRLNLNWDDEVPLDVLQTWNNFRTQIEQLRKLKIPRQVVCLQSIDAQLHCFCDASQAAYGAVIYVRSTDPQGNHNVWLLCSKSRVAPVKVISLPRLELCAALLGVRLVKVVLEATNIKYSSIRYWCDSTVVLSWLAGDPVQWTTFVANRTAEIQRLTDIHDWHHVRSENNPADIISRGIDCNQLHDCSFWWQGPNWLSKDENFWPQTRLSGTGVIPEQRSIRQSFLNMYDVELFSRYSSLVKLQRVVAYMLRFINNCKTSKGDRNVGTLTVEEIKTSMTVLVKLAQASEFREEIRCLIRSVPINEVSKLAALNPFLDEDQVLRVGGRLSESDLDYEQKHPVILPSKHRLTRLVITNEHYKLLHAGPQALLAQVRLKFWPIGGRRTVRSVLKNCIVCFRARPRDLRHLMGELPRHRVVPSRPFTNVGMDFAGPFDLKVYKLKGVTIVKGYLCVFVCFATRAVHLEMVGDLTTEAFLNCFKRFVARRGLCENIYSDNATNFVGANRELKHLYEFLYSTKNQNSFAEYFSTVSVKWHFIPPRSPHFGGLWESVVKAVKYHIKRTIGEHKLTFEEFSTIIAQIESCLNSRPITPLTEDPDDLNFLTPGHFLIGTSLCALPQENLLDHNMNKLRRYHMMTQIVQKFWSQWSKQYLSQLQQRNKWRSAGESIKIGAMVILKEDHVPPLRWQMGRVTQLHPGRDNTVRVVSVKTSKGVFKRALSRLCELPMEEH